MDENDIRSDIIKNFKFKISETENRIKFNEERIKIIEEDINKNNYSQSDPLQFKRLKTAIRHRKNTIKNLNKVIVQCEELIEGHDNRTLNIPNKFFHRGKNRIETWKSYSVIEIKSKKPSTVRYNPKKAKPKTTTKTIDVKFREPMHPSKKSDSQKKEIKWHDNRKSLKRYTKYFR